ncbi:CCA tRNA nucleotidyltransferase [Candidatus Woesearchaeota archaeon]|nr:CCA tRNA nucleotidyltransferase [Candidatus Woesearchaeota archaeon]
MDFSAVLGRLRPSAGERKKVKAAVASFVARLKVPGARVVVGGSLAKDTWISGVHDIDIFVCFAYTRYKSRSAGLSDLLEKSLKSSGLGFERLHGSRDYFQVAWQGFSFEVVPVLDIRRPGQALNITDASMLHARWVKAHVSPAMADEVRLLKAFCAAQGCYGAESYIRGFSGYVCEVLVARYGSFRAVLKAALKWKDKEAVDFSGFYRGRRVLDFMNESKTQSPVIVVDPVDRARNAAAALSVDKLEAFRQAARSFLKSPSGSFFSHDLPTAGELLGGLGTGFVVEAWPVRGRRDLVNMKIVKVHQFIVQQLARHGFRVLDSGIKWGGSALLWFRLASGQLPEFEVLAGPPVSADARHLSAFRKLHSRVVARRGRLVAYRKRKFRAAGELVASLLNDPYVRERVRRAVLNA